MSSASLLRTGRPHLFPPRLSSDRPRPLVPAVGGMVLAHVSGEPDRLDALVSLMELAHASKGAIVARIVHHDDFPVPAQVRQNGRNAGMQRLQHVAAAK